MLPKDFHPTSLVRLLPVPIGSLGLVHGAGGFAALSRPSRAVLACFARLRGSAILYEGGARDPRPHWSSFDTALDVSLRRSGSVVE
jgi:hypothetical protein